MFIGDNKRGYTRDGEQWSRGNFLILFDGPEPKTMAACVRHVRLCQMGHFMMGTAAVGGACVHLSGTYGGDGLPRGADGLPRPVRDSLVPVPDHLYQQWVKGGGHNSAGAEARDMHDWALGRLDVLKAAGSVRLPKGHEVVQVPPAFADGRGATFSVIFAGDAPYGAWGTYCEGGRRYWYPLNDFVVMQAQRVRAGGVALESGKHYRVPFEGKMIRAYCIVPGTSLVRRAEFLAGSRRFELAWADVP